MLDCFFWITIQTEVLKEALKYLSSMLNNNGQFYGTVQSRVLSQIHYHYETSLRFSSKIYEYAYTVYYVYILCAL